MVSEELLRSIVLAAAGLVVASAYGFVQRVSGFIDIKGEAALPSTGWTGVAGRYVGVFL